VEPDKRYMGFDAYKKVMARTSTSSSWLRPRAGGRALRSRHRRQHVFCEKPFGVDATGVRRMMVCKKATEKKLMCGRRTAARRPFYVETVDALKNGKLGDITAIYAIGSAAP
jgi:hypothetical protein